MTSVSPSRRRTRKCRGRWTLPPGARLRERCHVKTPSPSSGRSVCPPVVATGGGVADGGGDQGRVALACFLPELFMGPREDRDDIGAGGLSEAVFRNQPADCVRADAWMPSWPMKSSRFSSAMSS
jgi:hypothetical protein